VQALGIRIVAFGEEIDPGVPWTYSLDPEGFAIAMKSGNFGSPNLFMKAFEGVA
jgi:3-dehydrotetronate 4-kinase